MKQRMRKKKYITTVISKFLTVLIVFLVLICAILFAKTITRSEISIFGFKFYYVVTESMAPTIKPHSIIGVHKTEFEDLQVGDIISFVSSDPEIYGLVNTHRIYDITTDANGVPCFVTMGDHNPRPDSYYVYAEDIQGKVIFHTFPIRGLTLLLSFAATKTGFFVVIIMPLILVAGYFAGSFIKEMQKSMERELQSDRTVPNREEAEAQAARIILEQIFGKSLQQVTQNDIETLLQTLDASDGKITIKRIAEGEKNDGSGK